MSMSARYRPLQTVPSGTLAVVAVRSIVGVEDGSVRLRLCALDDDESAGTDRPCRAVPGVQMRDRLYSLAAATKPA
jgi:hypothetical protein